MAKHASREDLIKVITSILSLAQSDQRSLTPTGRLPHDVSRALAETVLEALAARDVRLSLDQRGDQS